MKQKLQANFSYMLNIKYQEFLIDDNKINELTAKINNQEATY